MNVLAQMNAGKHEQVVFVEDLEARLQAIIAIHDSYDPARALKLAGSIYSNVRKVFSIARELNITANEAADRIAEERLAQGARAQSGLGRDAIVAVG